jgi:uncharacterized lipoprotein YbaY/heat shock protein HslJ
MNVLRKLLAQGAIAVTALGGGGAFADSTVSGTATYRERMALPPGAVFEATLEDVSRADAPAEVIGRARIESPGAPPFRFSIAYEPAQIRNGRRYVVRARVTIDGQLLFTTDTAYSVLGPNGPTQIDALLRRVGSRAPPKPGASTSSARRIAGMYSYMADAGMFVDCASGNRLPVASEGDNAALEAAYLKVRAAPGAPVLAVVEGRIETRPPMEGTPRPTLIVERFVEVFAGRGCESLAGTSTLENTYWKLVRLRDTPVRLSEKQREPHLILQSEQRRLAGSSGCNRLLGSYTLDGERISFARTATTMMACPQGMDQERAFLDALATVERWRVTGERLELFDARGETVAQFESRHTK